MFLQYCHPSVGTKHGSCWEGCSRRKRKLERNNDHVHAVVTEGSPLKLPWNSEEEMPQETLGNPHQELQAEPFLCSCGGMADRAGEAVRALGIQEAAALALR